jgi:regulator of replication initiation timing
MLCMMLLGWCSCTTTKNVVKEKIIIDSLRVENLVDSVKVLTLENEKLQSEIRELVYSGVVFDTTRITDTVTNTVIIRPDGSIEATGRIKSAYSTIDKLTKTIKELYRINDSLRLVKQQVKTETKYVKDTKEKEVKRSFFPLILVIIAAGCLLFWLLKKTK